MSIYSYGLSGTCASNSVTAGIDIDYDGSGQKCLTIDTLRARFGNSLAKNDTISSGTLRSITNNIPGVTITALDNSNQSVTLTGTNPNYSSVVNIGYKIPPLPTPTPRPTQTDAPWTTQTPPPNTTVGPMQRPDPPPSGPCTDSMQGVTITSNTGTFCWTPTYIKYISRNQQSYNYIILLGQNILSSIDNNNPNIVISGNDSTTGNNITTLSQIKSKISTMGNILFTLTSGSPIGGGPSASGRGGASGSGGSQTMSRGTGSDSDPDDSQLDTQPADNSKSLLIICSCIMCCICVIGIIGFGIFMLMKNKPKSIIPKHKGGLIFNVGE